MSTGTIVEFCDCATESVAPGVLKGVKVCGFTSSNKRRYERAGLEKARQLYEGAAVHIDHPMDERGKVSPARQRTAESKFGRLENVRVGPDGVRADLRYLTSHPMAARVAEAAGSMPDAFGLSHNIDYTGRTEKDGTLIVESIDKVRSIDLVPNPATTKSLFESHEARPVQLTVKQLLGRVAAKLGPNKQKRLTAALVEMDGLGLSDTPTGLDDPGDDGLPGDKSSDEHLEEGFKNAIHAIVDDSSLSPEEQIERIKQLISAKHELTAGDGDDVAEPVGDGPADSKGFESAVEVARKLEKSGVFVTASLLEKCQGAKPELVASLAESLLANGTQHSPRTTGGPGPSTPRKGAATESVDPEKERAELVNSIKGGRSVPRIPE